MQDFGMGFPDFFNNSAINSFIRKVCCLYLQTIEGFINRCFSNIPGVSKAPPLRNSFQNNSLIGFFF